MVNDQEKLFVIKLNYEILDVTKKKNSRVVSRKKEKLYLVRDLDKAHEKLDELSQSFLDIKKAPSSNPIHRILGYAKNFGNRCNSTFYSMLST